jgi:shikimate dehydrogenase
MTPVSAATNVAGIIGWPVDRSLSPAIHNAAFSAAGLDWVYVAFPVRPGEGADAVEAMRALGVRGLNVTMPHKRDVIAALDVLSPEAERAGAVNTIVAEGSRLTGSNTDGAGFLRFLERDAAVDPAGATALVLGAGGAARSVGIALGDAGASVVVAARRPEQASEAAGLAGSARAASFEPDTLREEIARATIVVNATPVGLEGDDLPLDPASLTASHVVIDLIYHPQTTPLLRIARERGAKTFNGLGMLLHQAALSFEAWTGVPAPIQAMRTAVKG